MTQDEAKALVGKRAAKMVQSGMAVGLGTGTTSVMFIKALGERVRREGLKIRCVASSDSSAELGRSLGMDVVTLNELPELDVYIDGADEVQATASGLNLSLNLIKGGGAALLREKIVASAAKKFVCVVDQSKIVEKLGKFPLPVEIIKMALPLVERRLRDLELNPTLRMKKDGSGPLLTDEQNYILDCACGVIEEPEETAAEIRSIVGVVEHGLFLGMATLALVAGDGGVTEIEG
jgi:ribose 5-phosphate isomerase A